MAPSETRRSFLKALSLKRKADPEPLPSPRLQRPRKPEGRHSHTSTVDVCEDNEKPKPPHRHSNPKRFKELSIQDVRMLADCLCVSRREMCDSAFTARLSENDLELAHTRLGRLPKHLLSRHSTRHGSQSSTLCRSHRRLDYELVDDTLHILVRTLSRSARSFLARLNEPNGSQERGRPMKLAPDIQDVFDGLDRAGELIKFLCSCLDDKSSSLPTTRERPRPSTFDRPARSASPPEASSKRSSKSSSRATARCCPACHITALSSNISFLTSFRAFLLAYISPQEHELARRLAFVEKWISKCSTSDSNAIMQNSARVGKQIENLLGSKKKPSQMVVACRPIVSLPKSRQTSTQVSSKQQAPSPVRPCQVTDEVETPTIAGFNLNHEEVPLEDDIFALPCETEDAENRTSAVTTKQQLDDLAEAEKKPTILPDDCRTDLARPVPHAPVAPPPPDVMGQVCYVYGHENEAYDRYLASRAPLGGFYLPDDSYCDQSSPASPHPMHFPCPLSAQSPLTPARSRFVAVGTPLRKSYPLGDRKDDAGDTEDEEEDNSPQLSEETGDSSFASISSEGDEVSLLAPVAGADTIRTEALPVLHISQGAYESPTKDVFAPVPPAVAFAPAPPVSRHYSGDLVQQSLDDVYQTLANMERR